MFQKILIATTALAILGSSAVMAQGVKRTPLQKIEFPKGYNILTAIAEIAPNAMVGRHTHPGVEIGYVLKGEATLIVAGKPDQLLKAGDSFAVPAGVEHDIKMGDKPLKVMAVSVIEEGKPLSTPVAAK
jgi:quercetin dioxygenase-like cupin family protein